MPTIRRRGAKWQVQIRRAGFPYHSRSFATRSDANEWARYLERQADLRELPTNRKGLEGLTLGTLVTRYRDEIVSRKKGAMIETVILNRFLREPICRKPVADLTKADFAAYRDRRLSEISSKSLARQLSPLRNMFNLGRHEWGLPLANPLVGLTLKVADKRRDRRVSPEEIERLFHASKTLLAKETMPVALFALETAMRRGEILSMQWTDIDFGRRIMTIPETKNGHSRTIPLTIRAVELLRNRADKTGAVFRVTPNALKLSWGHLTKRAGVQDLHFHDLRHEAISRLFEKGLTVPEVAAISGHRDIRMLMRYAHADIRLVIGKLDARHL